ncbi:MAG: hypothetical protein CMP84_09675, partial [Gammaproteobacteria bacterium]|nr:hypothetical protein [Gammaproteobacteria bacterium]
YSILISFQITGAADSGMSPPSYFVWLLYIVFSKNCSALTEIPQFFMYQVEWSHFFDRNKS